ncbi:hypothetical protein AhyVDH1_039 [Aeromonas phage AhyVDH1]|nr:hypothetical protein AhyVDH1_039 [Aeromonas phage AhyVDH1]
MTIKSFSTTIATAFITLSLMTGIAHAAGEIDIFGGAGQEQPQKAPEEPQSEPEKGDHEKVLDAMDKLIGTAQRAEQQGQEVIRIFGRS